MLELRMVGVAESRRVMYEPPNGETRRADSLYS